MRKKQKSIALILGIMITTAIAALSSITLTRSVAESNQSKRYINSTKAFWLGEAGVQRAYYELNHGDGTWTGWVASGSKKTFTGTLGSGQYYIEIDDPSSNTPLVVATGYSAGLSDPSSISRAMEANLVLETKSPFTYAGFGKSSFTMSGNGQTDSYDTTNGAYGGVNVDSNGDIGTNAVDANAITLSGNADVFGNAGTGAGGEVDISGNAAVSGSITDDREEDFDSVIIPTFLSSLASGGSYSLGGNNSDTLIPGDYRYDSLTVSANADLTLEGPINIYLTSTAALTTSGNGSIIIDGAVKIYVDGKVVISGNGIVNNSSLPEDFIISSTYSGGADGVKISGNGDLYGAVYAPDSEIKVSGNGDVYGSLIGDEVKITGNGDVHYDEALASLSGVGNPEYVMQSWQEQSKPYVLVP